MNKLKKITVLSSESTEFKDNQELKSFHELNMGLTIICGREPKDNCGYSKTKVVFEWEDGTLYQARFDTKRDGSDTNAQEHLRKNIDCFINGPKWLQIRAKHNEEDAKKLEHFKKEFCTPETIKTMTHVKDNCSLEDV